MGEIRSIHTAADVDELAEALKARLGKGWRVEFSRMSRTETQNNCLHRWCDEIAKRLNDAGFGVKGLLKLMAERFEVPWSTTLVKGILYKPVMESQTGKKSTTELDTVEPSEICDIVGARVSELTGITAPPWPDRFNGGGRE